MGVIPYGRQSVDEADIEAVVRVLRSDFLTQGPAVPAFESAVAQYCRVPHAVAVNSGTSALHIACLALGVGPGDRVWTSPNSFVASANCARYCGADVNFVDIDPVTYNMSAHQLEAKLEIAAAKDLLPKVVIPVHFSGLPCDMAAIHALGQRYGFRIIEDASHALGAHYRNTVIGDCQFSDIVVFSFHPVKIITTAEGGIATTRSAELARAMQLIRSHGVTREQHELQRAREGAWYYEQHLLGFNYRLTELQAALGLSQISHLEQWVSKRHAIAERYDRAFAELPLILRPRAVNSRSALHLYVVLIDDRRTDLTRQTFFERLRNDGIGVNVHYIPIHTQPYYRVYGFEAGDFPVSEAYYERCVSLPMYVGLDDAQQDEVIHVVKAALI
ncbi:MAG TPA: UDP-4-amino-4,6-dideoxy-N-acetyl-beta-L-altrosamine transaminase [Candidatus Binatia bacterium]|nr:UDP-4-amino-4,6-dideoxy-N-acetyl-beta-L-altrosamine transaminase [Candidatus Binatia bacterium]